jgi:orotate phosphoribosyltransferase
LTRLRQALVEVIKDRGVIHVPQPVRLSSGLLSSYYIDVPAALSRSEDLMLASQAVLEAVRTEGHSFDAVGGATPGDVVHFSMALLSHKQWFVVRRIPKGTGRRKLIEGASIDAGARVLLVNNLVVTGQSMLTACHVLKEAGAKVVAAVALVDANGLAERWFKDAGLPYLALVTYEDLGVDPIRPS